MTQQPLANRHILITGASAGIGAATARALAAQGADLTLVARRMERLEATALELRSDSVKVQCIDLDVRDADAVQKALEPLELDGVINNAGLAIGTEKLAEGVLADWSTVIDTNIKGVLNVLRSTLSGLAQRKGDHVFLGSVAGRQVYPGGNVYCATKHAVRALYESARVDLFGSGIRFATVDPGAVHTEFSQVRFRGDGQQAEAVYQGFDPLQAQDVAEAIGWVLSRPPHVNVGELVIWPRAQASTTLFDKD